MQLNDSIQGLPSNGSAHVPVLAAELLNLLDPQPDDTIIDCTFGAGGHARKVARELGQDAVFIGVDRDPVAKRYFDLFSQYQPFRCRFIHGNFADALEDLNQNGFEADLIYLDLGVSSMQLDRPERGFSYSYNAPLDMRMDPSGQDHRPAAGQRAVPTPSWRTSSRHYGEERYAGQIARRICARAREETF